MKIDGKCEAVDVIEESKVIENEAPRMERKQHIYKACMKISEKEDLKNNPMESTKDETEITSKLSKLQMKNQMKYLCEESAKLEREDLLDICIICDVNEDNAKASDDPEGLTSEKSDNDDQNDKHERN